MAVLVDGTVLVAGGVISGTTKGAQTSAERFDPSTGTWSSTGNMLTAREDFTATRS